MGLLSVGRKKAADLANVLIVETVPLAITKGLDTGIVVPARSTPRMDHDRKQLKGQQTLRGKKNNRGTLFRSKQQ